MSLLKNKYLYFFQLMRNKNKSSDELAHIQNTKFTKLLKHAYSNVPFYNNLFMELDIHPDDIKSIEDIHKLPIIDKSHFHTHPESFFISNTQTRKENLIPINTSGSSGISLRFYIDHHYDQLRKAQYLRPYYTNGRKPKDKVLRFLNTPVSNSNWFQQLGYFVEHHVYSDSNLEGQIEAINHIKPEIIQGFGSCLALLASKIIQEKRFIHCPKIIFTDSELLTDQMRTVIQQCFCADIIDVYGTYETDNIAYECHRHEGYHIASDCVVMEFIKENKPVSPGESGEIVCTVLDNLTMPFIRYNLKDTGRFTNRKCSCGIAFPLMEMLDGRSDDFAVHENGLLKSPRNFLGLFDSFAEHIHEYQIVQDATYSFTVKIVPKNHFKAVVIDKIKKSLRVEFPNAHVDIEKVDLIKREKSGKLRAFKSLVKSC